MLGSFLLAPLQIGALCSERGLTSAHFHLPAHRIIFDALMSLHAARKSGDFVTLTQGLRDAGMLEDAGGAAYITDLFTFLPTAAMCGHYIEILEEKYTLREAIKIGTESIARAYDEQDQVWSLISDLQAKAKGLAERVHVAGVRETLAALRFDLKNPPPEPEPVFRLGEEIIATPGNILAVQAKAKAG